MKKFFLIIAIFLLHYLLVKFGSLFTIPFGYSSVIWPITGVMFGLYLIYGRIVLLTVFIASVLMLKQDPLTTNLPYFELGVLASFSLIQCVIGKWLIHYGCELPFKTNKPMAIVKTLLLIGPLASFISVLLVMPVIGHLLTTNTETLLYICVVKWLGNTLSIIFIAPIPLFLTKNIYIAKTKGSKLTIATSFLSLILISSIYLFLNTNTYEEQAQKFVNSTQPFTEKFRRFQNQIKTKLMSLDGLFQASDEVTRDDFNMFITHINNDGFKVRAIGWAPFIEHKNRHLFEKSLSEDLGFSIKIKTMSELNFVIAPKQAKYLPVTYTEPLIPNQSAIGLDLYSHPIVNNTIGQSIQLKDFVISPLLTLAQQRDKYTGAIVYYPVLKNIASSEGKSLLGVLEVVIELDVFFTELYEELAVDEFFYQINYGENNAIKHNSFDGNRVFNHHVNLMLFDKEAKLSFTSTNKFERGLIQYPNLLIVVISCVLGIVCVMFAFFILRFNYSLNRKVKESTQLLTQKNEELIVANQAKNLFLANISHEYRTPLNAIIGFTEVAQREIIDKKALSYLNQIQHSSNILLNIVNDVLDTSKIQAGELTLDSHPFQPSEVTAIVIDILNDKANDKALKIHKKFSPAYSRWVEGDDTRFKQIVINLLNNAIKFTEHGEVTITGDWTEINETMCKLVIEVTDTGIGIDESAQKRLFKPFAQAENTTSRKFGGTGLGLSIVKQLCLLMDGDVSLHSELGKGSTFTVSLHLPKSKPPVIDNIVEKQVGSFNKERILVVEDNKINQMVIQKQLSSFDVNCDFADDGQQALDYLEHNQPDLILMDLQMPVMDGFTASVAIKKNVKTSAIPIVILSASVVKEDREKASSLNIHDFINKPFTQNDLLAVLNKYLIPSNT